MAKKQILILIGVGLALVYSGGLFWLGMSGLLAPEIMPKSEADVLTYVFKWMLLLAFPMLAAIVKIAQVRFFDPDLIDGDLPAPTTPADIDNRYLRNTIEQTIVAAVSVIALGVQLPHAQLGLIPLLCMSFVVTRLIFWAGYHLSPPLRAFGFGGTFYPTIGTFVYAFLLAF